MAVVSVPSPPPGTCLTTGRWWRRRRLHCRWWRWRRRLDRRWWRRRWWWRGGRRRANGLRPSLALRRLCLRRVRRRSRRRRRGALRPRRRRHAHEVGGMHAPHAPLHAPDLPGTGGHALLDRRPAEQVERVERDLRKLSHLRRRDDQQRRPSPSRVDRGPPEIARAHRRSNERRQPQDCGGQHFEQFEATVRQRG